MDFVPARSMGWLWPVGLLLLILVPVALAVMTEPGAIDELYPTLAIMAPIAVLLIVVALSFRSMRYTIASEGLVIRCGPLLKWRVPYADIDEVARRDLTPTVLSEIRFPGLAMWTVHYAGVGKIKMCATRMARAVMLIETPGVRYGITPEDEETFLRELSARMQEG